MVETDARLGQEDVQVAGEKTVSTRAAPLTRVVNVQDLVAIRNQMPGFCLGTVPTIFGDGKVDILDYIAVRKLIGTHL